MFHSLTAIWGHILKLSKMQYIYIYTHTHRHIYIHTPTHTYSPYGFTLWDPRSVLCLLQYEIVKCGLIVADSCKIILGLVKLNNG